MKAMQIDRFGGPEELRVADIPTAGRIAAQNKGTPYADIALSVVAGIPHGFIHDPRFSGPKVGGQ